MEGDNNDVNPFDGYETQRIDGTDFTRAVWEFKNVRSNPPFNKQKDVEQAIAHIDFLVEQRRSLEAFNPDVDSWLNGFTYNVVTTSTWSVFDRDGAVLDHARAAGVNLIRWQLRKTKESQWYLDGDFSNRVIGRWGDATASIPYGEIPKWLEWIDQPGRDWSENENEMTCHPDPDKEGAPRHELP